MALVDNGYGGINLPESAKQLDERLAVVEKAVGNDATETADVAAISAEILSITARVAKLETELAAISAAATSVTTSTATATETAAKS